MLVRRRGIWQFVRDPTCLAYYEADLPNVVLNAGNTSLLRNSSVNYTESARDEAQSTALNQPGYTPNNETFGGHGSINLSASKWMRTGTLSVAIAQPFTAYFVTKFSSGSVDEMVFDGLADGARAAVYCSSTGAPGMFAGSVVTGSGNFRNKLVIGAAVFNGASSYMYWNDPNNPVFSGNPGTQGLNGITLGIDRTMSAFQHLGSTAALGIFSGAHSAGKVGAFMGLLDSLYGGGITGPRCLSFVGSSSQYVTLGNVLGFERTDAVSISFWVRWSNSNYQVFISKQSAAQVGAVLIGNTLGQFEVNLQNTWASNCIFVRTVQGGFNDGLWHQVTVTYDGSSTAAGVLVYVDGQARTKEVVYDSLSSTIVNTASLWFGGRDTGANPYHATAHLDEVAYYNVALSAAQAEALYNKGVPLDLSTASSPPPANLTGWWRLGDSDTYPTITDRSGGGRNGTMTNMTLNSIVPRWRQ